MAALRDRLDSLRSWIATRRHAYNVTFRGPLAEIVLADLNRFCRGTQTTFHEDARVSALMEGRREVFLRIQEHLNLGPEELFELVTGQSNRKATHITADEE